MPNPKMSDYSEYDGAGVMPNTIYPKGEEALSPADKFRLEAMTGQDQDSRAPVDPFHWYGNVAPAEAEPGPTDAEKFFDPDRYRETDS